MFEDKISLLESVLGEATIRRHGTQAYFHCPFCNHYKKKLNVNLETGQYHCWVCNESNGSAAYLLGRFDRNLIFQWKELQGDKSLDRLVISYKILLPDGFIRLASAIDKDCPYYKRSIRYLLDERGLVIKDLEKFNVGYVRDGPYSNYVIFPSYDAQGDLNYFVARAVYKNMNLKYKNPLIDKTSIIFNELFIDFSQPIVLVEGVFDAIIGGDNFIPILGNSISEDSRLLARLIEEKPIVYIALDDDAYNYQTRIASSLYQYGIRVYSVYLDVGVKDIGSMKDRERVKRLIPSAVPYSGNLTERLERRFKECR